MTHVCEIEGKRCAILREEELNRLVVLAGLAEESVMPALPKPDAGGNYPATEYLRATIARGIVRDRLALGWSQVELSRRSGVRVETLNRIERAKVTAAPLSIDKIDRALKAGQARAGAADKKSRVRRASWANAARRRS